MPVIPHTDIDVFGLNLGGNPFGWTSDRDESFAVLDAYAAGGGNFVDTADMYSCWKPGNSGGESEEILGEWLASRGVRDRIVVATKVGKLPGLTGLAPQTVATAVDDSLRRLGTDVIDLYYAHADDPDRPVEEIAATFDALVRAGKVRALAASNWSAERLRAWLDVAAAEGLTGPVAIQPSYSLVNRAGFESDGGPVAREYGLGVFCYHALASGFLSGKYRADADRAQSARGESVGRFLTPDGLALLEVLDGVAAAHGVHVAAVALAWLRARGVTAPIASARTPEQVPPLLAGAVLALADDELAALDAASAPFA